MLNGLCPARLCSTPLGAKQVMCYYHWRLLPIDLRERIAVRWSAGASSEHFRNAVQEAVKWVDANDRLA